LPPFLQTQALGSPTGINAGLGESRGDFGSGKLKLMGESVAQLFAPVGEASAHDIEKGCDVCDGRVWTVVNFNTHHR